MVNIHNLSEKSSMEVIDFVKKCLLKQNCKSEKDGQCVYRGDNGAKCAAGHLIPDEDYRPSMEGKGWRGLIESYKFPKHHRYLIQDLQSIHDTFDVKDWAEKIDNLYLIYKDK